jgi:hypothetical protein
MGRDCPVPRVLTPGFPDDSGQVFTAFYRCLKGLHCPMKLKVLLAVTGAAAGVGCAEHRLDIGYDQPDFLPYPRTEVRGPTREDEPEPMFRGLNPGPTSPEPPARVVEDPERAGSDVSENYSENVSEGGTRNTRGSPPPRTLPFP